MCPYLGFRDFTSLNEKKIKNGDAPGPLGDFVMSPVTERTKTKRKNRKRQNENLFNFTKHVNIIFKE